MKAVLIMLCAVALIDAGSASAISNLFSLGKPAGVIEKKRYNPLKGSNFLKISRKNNGILFETNSTEKIYSLSIISISGRIIKDFRTNGVTSIYWNGCNSYRVRLTNECYLAKVNGRPAQAFILSEKVYGK